MVIGREDEYYGSNKISSTYQEMVSLYQDKGLSEDEIKTLAILDIKDQAYFDNLGAENQHGGGNFVSFDKEIMSWLFNY